MTPRDSAEVLLESLIAGRTIKEAAYELGLDYTLARQRLHTFYKSIGARTIAQAVAIVVTERLLTK